MPPVRSITVYCSSSRDVARSYFDAAADLGRAIAQQGWQLVYGGNDCGCMGALANAARSAGGTVVGVTPTSLHHLADNACHELLVTETMRERKALLEQRGDAFITLPGGIGTLEELFEILVARSLGDHDKPIVLLNLAGFYDPLLALLDHGIEQKFIRPKSRDLLHVCNSVADAVQYLKTCSNSGR